MLQYISRRRGATVIVLTVLALLSFALARPGTSPVSAAPVTILNETFDSATNFTIEDNDSVETFFSDGSSDYLGLTDGASSVDYGAGSQPSGEKAYTGFTGRYLNGQDLDGEGASKPFIFTWSGLSISGATSLEFSGDFAEFFDSPGDIDNVDFMRIEYQIDSGGFQNLLWFSPADFSSSTYNGIFREDTNFDGLGDGTALGNAAQTFTKSIPGTGSTLDIRLLVSVDAGDEDFAVDNFVVTGDVTAAAPNVVLNDFVVSTTGADTEYVEIAGAASTDLTGLSLLEVFTSGSIGDVIDFTGQTIPADGFFVAASPAAVTNFAITPDMGIANNTFGNSTRTYLLVFNFTGASGDDLDTNDDGTLDVIPWDSVVDEIAFIDSVTDTIYTSVIVGPDGSFLPAGAYRCGDITGTWTMHGFTAVLTDGTPGESNATACAVADAPPQVTTTVPTDAATNVAVTDTITVNFDENVDIAAGAISVSCPSYGAASVSTATATGVSTFTFDPTDFANSETCTVTVVAAQVTDSGSNNLDGNGDGTGGDDYTFTFTTETAPVSANTNLVINEVEADTPGTDVAEFVELYDGGVGNTALDGLVLVLFNGSSDTSYQAYDLDGRSTDANGFFVVCGDAGNVANCDLDVSPDSNLVQNGADAVALYTADDTDFTNGTAVTTTNLVDALVYDTDDGDDAGLLVLLNAGQPQVNERDDSGAGSDGTANSMQRCPDGDPATDQRNTVDFQQWPPTPGVTNACAFADNPPQVTTTAPADAATGVATNTTITIDFDEDVDLTASAITVECPVATPVTFSAVPALAANDTSTITLTPDSALPQNTTCTVTVLATETTDNDGTADQLDGNGDGTGGDDYVFTFTTVNPASACSALNTHFIHDIQGSGATSPLFGSTVTVQGVVTSLAPAFSPAGFTIQEEDAEIDADALTSEGIYIETGSMGTVGNVVQITGTVTETFGVTTIQPTTIEDCATTDTITPTVVQLPLADYDSWENYEGMLVDVQAATGPLTVNDVYNVGRYGAYQLASGGRIPNYTQANAPGAGYSSYQDQIEDRTILIDDAINAQNPDPAITVNGSEMSATNTLRAGYTVNNVVGVVTFAYSEYRIFPTQTVNFVTSSNPRTSAPGSVGASDIRVASFNVLNYFNGDGSGGGFPTSRGAESLTEFNRQRDKTIEAILALDADIVGLVEMENDGFGANSAIQDLVNGLNAAGTRTYTFADPGVGTAGTDAIMVAIIYDSNVVSIPAGTTVEILDDSDAGTVGFTTPLFDGVNTNRAAIAATFEVIAAGNPSLGEQLVVTVNHFKSKGGSGSGGDADAGDGQGNWNARRTAAAQAVIDWLATDPTGSGDPDVLILGDLNAYSQEDPITTLEGAGFTDLAEAYGSTYSYGYPNDLNADPSVQVWGTLDYAMANASLLTQVTGATDWHINADEPLYMDYNTNYQSTRHVNTMYNVDPYRASDHDPVVVGLTLGQTVTTTPTVTGVVESNSMPLNGATITEAIDQIDITFNIPVQPGTGADGAANPANYILLAEGATAGFQTVDCAAGVDAGDTQIIQSGTSYASPTTILTFAPALENGTYRLHICGTTSIVSAADGTPLNDGADEVIDFTITISEDGTGGGEEEPGSGDNPGSGEVPQQPEELGVEVLPSTGETPQSRDIILVALAAAGALVLGAGFVVWNNRPAN